MFVGRSTVVVRDLNVDGKVLNALTAGIPLFKQIYLELVARALGL